MQKLARSLFRFGADESGAVTVDWVALTAGSLLLGTMVVFSVFDEGVAAVVGNINSSLTLLGEDVSSDYKANSGTEGGSSTPVAVGSASQRACDVTLKYQVCFGNK